MLVRSSIFLQSTWKIPPNTGGASLPSLVGFEVGILGYAYPSLPVSVLAVPQLGVVL